MIVAELTGEARHHARWRPLTGDEEATAVAELRAIAGGRADLLAEVAGIFEGTSEGELDEPLVRQAADLCRKAGADPDAISRWVEEGRRRAESARKMPHSGQPRGYRQPGPLRRRSLGRGHVLRCRRFLHHSGVKRRLKAAAAPRGPGRVSVLVEQAEVGELLNPCAFGFPLGAVLSHLVEHDGGRDVALEPRGQLGVALPQPPGIACPAVPHQPGLEALGGLADIHRALCLIDKRVYQATGYTIT